MPAAAVKLVPPFSPRGLYLLSIILGSVFGLAINKEERWGLQLARSEFIHGHLAPAQANLVGPLVTIVAAFVPAFLIGLWLSCLSQRRAQIALAAALTGTAQVLVALLAGQVLWSDHGGTDWRDWPPIAYLINLSIIAGVSALTALLVRWLIRSLLFTVVEQDGTRCSRCGYRLGAPTITTCPECGAPSDTSRPSFARLHRVSTWLQRRSPLLASVLVVLLVVQLAVTVSRRTIPALRFRSAFPCQDNTGPGVIIPFPPSPGTSDASCAASWLPFPNDSSRALVIFYVPDHLSPLPAMRLAVAATPTPLAPTALPGPHLNFGSPEIGCDLPRDIAERVILTGIPPALVQALADEADRSNWTPATAPLGIFSATTRTHWIDAGPYFSAP
jgi:hypothetical protein